MEVFQEIGCEELTFLILLVNPTPSWCTMNTSYSFSVRDVRNITMDGVIISIPIRRYKSRPVTISGNVIQWPLVLKSADIFTHTYIYIVRLESSMAFGLEECIYIYMLGWKAK